MASIGRSLGDFGNQVGEGYGISQQWQQRAQQMALANARQKQADLQSGLQKQELQQRMLEFQQRTKQWQQQQAQLDPNAQIASVEKLIGRPMTPQERLQFAGLKPQPSAVPKYSDTKVNTAGQMTGVNSTSGQMEVIPGSEQFKYEVPGTRAETRPETQIFNGYKWQNDPTGKVQGPRDPTGQWVRLGRAKEPGNEKTPSEYDQRITNYLAANKLPDTPANRDKADQALGVRNKQTDHSDAIKAYSAAVSAVNRYRSAQMAAIKAKNSVSDWHPTTWSAGKNADKVVAENASTAEGLRQSAIQEMSKAQMNVPSWLMQPLESAQPTQMSSEAPPPQGYELDRKK